MSWIENRRVVITGATSGIGREVATELASLGAHVILACRDLGRADEVARQINARTGTDRVTTMGLDTSDPESILTFAAAYRDRHCALDVLVNNAGVLLTDRQTSVEGVELTFATNVLGYYRLTNALLEALRSAGSARVVNVASTFAFGVDLDDPQFQRRPYDGMTAYAQSKACNRMLTWAFARRLAQDSITVNAMAPGLVLGTGLYRQLPEDTKRELAQYGSREISEGAETGVWLASAAEVTGVTGKFFEQRHELPCEFRGQESEETLWRICRLLSDQQEARHVVPA